MRTIIAAAALLALAACKPSLLPNSEVEDTEETRAIYNVVEAYRQAMEQRDADLVISMLARDYFETGGTEDPADDYGYDEATKNLREDLERTIALRLEIHLKEIEVDEEQATVVYRFRSRAQVRFPAGDQWITHTDVNRMRLKKIDDTWKIASGL